MSRFDPKVQPKTYSPEDYVRCQHGVTVPRCTYHDRYERCLLPSAPDRSMCSTHSKLVLGDYKSDEAAKYVRNEIERMKRADWRDEIVADLLSKRRQE